MNHRIGERLKKLRKINKLTVKDIIKKMSKINYFYSPQSVYKWEEGEVLPNIATLSVLCSIYKVSINYFLSDEELSKINLTNSEIFLLDKIRTDSDFKKIALAMINRYKKENNK